MVTRRAALSGKAPAPAPLSSSGGGGGPGASLSSKSPDSRRSNSAGGNGSSLPAVRSAGDLAGNTHTSSKRPENLSRSVFHATWGCVVVSVCLTFHNAAHLFAWGAAALTLALAFEMLKIVSPKTKDVVMTLFKPVAHEWESKRFTSATWFAAGLLCMSVSRSHLVCTVGAAVCAVGDPAAGFFGRRFGKTRLRAGRSVEGSLAFVIFGGMLAFVALTVASRGGLEQPQYFRTLTGWLEQPRSNENTDTAKLALLERAVASLVGGICGALAEIVSTSIDDNLTVGPAAGYGAAAAVAVLRRML